MSQRGIFELYFAVCMMVYLRFFMQIYLNKIIYATLQGTAQINRYSEVLRCEPLLVNRLFNKFPGNHVEEPGGHSGLVPCPVIDYLICQKTLDDISNEASE